LQRSDVKLIKQRQVPTESGKRQMRATSKTLLIHQQSKFNLKQTQAQQDKIEASIQLFIPKFPLKIILGIDKKQQLSN